MSAGPMLTVEQVSQRLNCHEQLVRRLINSGRLPAVKFGKEWRIDPADLEEFLARHRTEPAVPVIPITERLPEPSRRRFL